MAVTVVLHNTRTVVEVQAHGVQTKVKVNPVRTESHATYVQNFSLFLTENIMPAHYKHKFSWC